MRRLAAVILTDSRANPLAKTANYGENPAAHPKLLSRAPQKPKPDFRTERPLDSGDRVPYLFVIRGLFLFDAGVARFGLVAHTWRKLFWRKA